ncbi:hypothetical protein O3P69_011727 [Scylla paramamosain]|uniref:Uncharacterized protein n=1 Tax=Scylla paramamosain TaxID=85552 RepID=A0AAW0SCR8_SCYPA
MVLWDFKGRCADVRYQSAEPLRSLSWHHEGEQGMCCHMDRDTHESPDTCCTHLADCPADLNPALYLAGAREGGHRKQGFSEKEWPISGREWDSTFCPYPEMTLTG